MYSTVGGGVLEGRRGYPQGWFRGVGPSICQLVPHSHLGDARQMLTLHKPRGRLRSREIKTESRAFPQYSARKAATSFLWCSENAQQARAVPQHAAPDIGVSALLQTTVASDPEHGCIVEHGPINERRRFHGQPRQQQLPAARCRARVA